MSRCSPILIACLVAGCSLVFDPGNHTGGEHDAGSGMDAGSDAGFDAGFDAGPPTVPLEEMCDRMAAIYCDAVRDCCSRLPTEPPWDDTECLSNVDGQCTDVFRLVSERTALEYDPALAYQALEEGRLYAEECDVAVQDWYLDRTGFFAPIVGTVPMGGRCEPNSEIDPDDIIAATLACAGDNRCIRAGAGTWRCGEPAAHGDPCTVAFDCVSGSRCTRSGVRAMCAATGEPAGSSCIADDECDSLICDGPVGRRTCAERNQDNVYCPSSLVPDAP